MNPETDRFDTIIVGAGLAGASVALHLSRQERVLLIEADKPGAGASGVAGGLFSPLIALRGRPVWRIDEAIDAFRHQLDIAGATDLFDDRGVLRPAKDPQQVEFFKQSARMAPQHAVWLPPEEARARYPKIASPLGALFASTGGACSTSAFATQMTRAAVKNGATLLSPCVATNWGETADTAYIDVCSATDTAPANTRRYYAGRLILAIGRTFFEHPALQTLDLHAVKGQTIRVKRPAGLAFEDLPPTSGLAYIIPEQDTLAIGSSFEHTFEDDALSDAVTQSLLDKAAAVLPGLEAAPVLEAHVGIRVTVPRIRLPMVGPLPGRTRTWAFTAFGSKGLLLAPLLARALKSYFTRPELIPDEIRVRIKTL